MKSYCTIRLNLCYLILVRHYFFVPIVAYISISISHMYLSIFTIFSCYIELKLLFSFKVDLLLKNFVSYFSISLLLAGDAYWVVCTTIYNYGKSQQCLSFHWMGSGFIYSTCNVWVISINCNSVSSSIMSKFA